MNLVDLTSGCRPFLTLTIQLYAKLILHFADLARLEFETVEGDILAKGPRCAN